MTSDHKHNTTDMGVRSDSNLKFSDIYLLLGSDRGWGCFSLVIMLYWNKSEHDITEILLKVALNTITHNPIAEILLKMIMDKNYVTLPTRPSALKIGLVISLKRN